MYLDSSFASLEEAIRGTTAPEDVVRTLALIDVPYQGYDGTLRQGQLVVHQGLVREAKDIFEELLWLRFPIARVVPIAAYGWDDEASMADNNCSAFNYRLILGTDRLSNHSFGRAVDINPLQNPYFARDGKTHPSGSVYDPRAPGTLVEGGKALNAFLRRGWVWGGRWTVPKDYQHLEKP